MTRAIGKLEVLASVLAVLQIGYAQTYTWTSGVSGLWSDPAKWTPNGQPVAGDKVDFGTVAADTTVTIGTAPSVSFANVTVTGGSELVFKGKSASERSLTIANSASDLQLTGGPWTFQDMDAVFNVSYSSNRRLLMTGATGSTTPTELVLAGDSTVTFSGTKLLLSGDYNGMGARVTVGNEASLIVTGSNAELQPGRGRDTWGGIVQQGGVIRSDAVVTFGNNVNSFGTWETFGGAVTNAAVTRLAFGNGSAGAWYVHGGTVRLENEVHLGSSGRAELFVDGGTLDFSGQTLRVVSRTSDSDSVDRPSVFTLAGATKASGYGVRPYGENSSYTGHSRAQVNLNDTSLLSLNGGFGVKAAGSTRATLSFNGGTLERVTGSQDSDENKSLLSGVDAVVYPGGGKLKARKSDGSASNMRLNSARFRKAGGFGVRSIAVTSGGSGYLLPPLVDITGGSGSNATAVAQVDYETGAITNVVVTCPGEGYAADDVLGVKFVVPSAPTVVAAQAAVTLAENAVGTLSVVGNSTVLFGASFAYDGDLAVETGSELMISGLVTLGGASSFTTLTIPDGGTLTLKGPASATRLEVRAQCGLAFGDGGSLTVSGYSLVRGKLTVDCVPETPLLTVTGDSNLEFSSDTSVVEVGPSVPVGDSPIVIARTTGTLKGKPQVAAASAEHWRVRVVETADGTCLTLQPRKGLMLIFR